MADGTKPRLSCEIEIACDIYSLTAAVKPIWFGKLKERFAGKYTAAQIGFALDTLIDWGVIYGEYGPTECGRAARCYHIDDDHIDRIAQIYRNDYTPPPGAEPGEGDWPRHLESTK